jgi:glucosamine--fructose-6-phosphate aminotransferase (isomerizing)
MCGIVGYVGGKPGLGVVLEGLRRLEYRGYDSAGVAVLSDDGELRLERPRRQARQPSRWRSGGRGLPGTLAFGHNPLGHPRPPPPTAYATPTSTARGRRAVVH